MRDFDIQDQQIRLNTADLQRSIQEEAMAAMVIASQHAESGLLNAGHQEARQRVLDITFGQTGRPQLHIDSSGLGLDEKLFIERILLRHLDLKDFFDVSIYFRKASKPQANSQGPSLISKKSAFGIEINKRPIDGVRNVIAVASGKGGVGKSTVATNLAVGLSHQGLRVGLLDCDVYGPSSQVMLGVSGAMEVANGRLVPLERHGIKVVSFGFLSDSRSPVIWRGPLVSKSIEQLCYDVLWGNLDVLVLDLPPGTGDVQLTLAERIPITGSIIVTTPQTVALIDAHKAVSMFEKLGVTIHGVVENMSHHTCSACGHEDDLFGKDEFENFVRERQLPILAKIPINRDIRVACDQGEPIVLGHQKISENYQSLARSVALLLTNRETQSRHIGSATKINSGFESH